MSPTPKPKDTPVLATVLALASALTLPLLRIGWVPSDEGTLAQSALRVYQGQLPQRDFAEIYTGGLSLLHAAAFHLFGINLVSLRLCVFALFLLWIPAVYYIARRLLSPLWAGIATLTCVAWTLPNYPAAMPSWYNLYFATFGVACLLRYLALRHTRWLLLAGLCGGLSILIKIVGLYYVAGALLYLLFLENEPSHEPAHEPAHESAQQPASAPRPRATLYRIACGLLLAGYLAALTHLLAPQLHPAEAFHFLLPSVACVVLLLLLQSRPHPGTSLHRTLALARLVLPFALGIALPIAAFLLLYAPSRTVHLVLHTLIASTAGRISDLAGRSHLPGLGYTIYGLATIALLCLALPRSAATTPRRDRILLCTVPALAAILACSALLPGLQDTWLMAGTLTPLAVLFAATLLFTQRNTSNPTHPNARPQLALLLCLAATCSLIQFPVSYVTYFCYTAPFTLLCVIATTNLWPHPTRRPILAALLLFFLGLGLFGLVPKHIYNPELRYAALHTSSLPRMGSLRTDPSTPDYDTLIPLLQSHSPNGLLYAGNDCPELYFLSGLRNPTRDDTGATPAEILAALNSGTLHIIALNDQPFFTTGAIPPNLRATIAHRLPHTQTLGRFTLYWD